ncbi:MAG: PAS domain-containing protein [Bacteroidetes bacterium]|nr:PAS domain-containing protein [Bacteroidota bacterium]
MKGKFVFWFFLALNAVVLSIIVWQQGFSWAALAILGTLLFLLWMQHATKRFINELVSLSNQDEVKSDKKLFIKEHLASTQAAISESRLAIESINEIGREKFIEVLQTIKDTSIRASLESAHIKIVDLRKKEEESNWVTLGIASIAELKHQGNDLAAYSFQAISNIVKYLQANQGGFYLLKQSGEESYFELTASYAYGKKKYIEQRINPGQGLIGQVYYEKEIVYLTDVPKDYIKITSGLGEALPRCVCIVPLMTEGEIHGVIEIASFHELKPYHFEYLKKISESMGYNLGSIETHARTERLLEESQKMAQEVKSQEEELRQNMEELNATQEQMLREKKQLETLSLVADHTNNSVLIADANGRIIYTNAGFTKLSGYEFDEVVGKKPGSFLQGPLTDRETVANISAKLRQGEPVYDEILNYSKSKQIYWISLVINPIKDEHGVVQKFVSIQAEITNTKKNALDNLSKLQSISRTNAVIEFNMDGKVLEANDLFYKVTGFQSEQIVGKSFEVLIPEEDKTKPQHSIMWQNILLGQAFTGEFRYIDVANKVQWLSGTYNPIFDVTGKAEKILMLAQFVTQDKEKMQDMQETITALKTGFPMAELNADMTFKSANDLFLTELGIKRLELKKVQPRDVLSAESFKQITQHQSSSVEQPDHFDLDLQNKSGENKRFSATIIKVNGNTERQRRSLLILKNNLS